ncbi:MAG: hypothetical protein VKO21_00550 [Candidatus Sericytochromatia bacterium]|nr:hypothetical protein [Candidatus Sericytochromatia bacterium]
MSLNPRRHRGAVALLLAAGCSSTSPTSPGGTGAQLPPATGVAGAAATNAKIDKATVKGRLVDALTGKPVEDVQVWAEMLPDELPESEMPGPRVQASGSQIPPPPGTGSAGVVPPAGAIAPARAAASPKPPGAVLEKPLRADTDEKGQFEWKDLPVGTYAYTVWHRDYTPLTIVGGRPASGRFNLKLTPRRPERQAHEVTGKVQAVNRRPTSGIQVAAALPADLAGEGLAVTDGEGGFRLGGLPPGKRAVAAWLPGEPGEIRAFGLVRSIRVAEGKEGKTDPVELTLRAVSRKILLAGRVVSPRKELLPRQVQAFFVPDSGQECLVSSVVPDEDGRYRFTLPQPEASASYHLRAVAVDGSGNASQGHAHQVTAQGLSLDFKLPDLGATPSVGFDGSTAFTWAASPEVSAYRVRLEEAEEDLSTVWEAWTTSTLVRMPKVPSLALRKGAQYRFSVTAVKMPGSFELPEAPRLPWAVSTVHAPVSFVAGEEPRLETPRPQRPSVGQAPGGGVGGRPVTAEPAGPGPVRPAMTPVPGRLPPRAATPPRAPGSARPR